jgi:hypothetical protein
MYVTSSELLSRISWHLLLRYFTKICQYVSSIGYYQAITTTFYEVVCAFALISSVISTGMKEVYNKYYREK